MLFKDSTVYWAKSAWRIKPCTGSRKLKQISFGNDPEASWILVCLRLIEFNGSGEVCPLLARCRNMGDGVTN